MKTRTAAAVATLVTLLGSPLAIEAPLAQVSVAPETGRVIVKYRADSGLARKHALTANGQRTLQMEALGSELGVALRGGSEIADRLHVVLAQGVGSAALAAKLTAHPDIEYAVVDQKRRAVAVPNDPFYATRPYNNPTTPTSGGPLAGQWYLQAPTTMIPSAINAEAAWDVTTGSASIVVAVLDSGARLDHPDLQGGKMVAGYDFVAADTPGVFVSANDGDGRDADPSDPGDWVTTAEAASGVLRDCDVVQSSWHGTQTMSIVGAQTNNGVGMAGAGWNVRVQPVRVLGKCGGYDSDILAGMRWAAGLAVPNTPTNLTPAKVLNMSLGGTGACSTAYRDAIAAINAAGVAVVASAGNSAGRSVGTPANCPGVIAVGGLRHVGTKVGFSDLGPEVALSAPGGNCVNTGANSPCLYGILTATNAGLTTPVAGGTYSDAFNASFGTSFSAPMVSAVAGLMLSSAPTLTPAQLRALLTGTATPFPTTGGTLSITTSIAEPTAGSPLGLGTAAPPACSAPGGTDQLECHCSAGLCGAGMLNARRAVLAAAGGTATPAPGPSRVPTAYAWTLVDGGGIVSAIQNPSTATPSVTPSAAGTFVVRLTTTYGPGDTAVEQRSITVAAAPPPADSDSGGGALGLGWLVLLALGVLALGRESRRRVA